jgi:2-methylcitrate dehydratase PrpD
MSLSRGLARLLARPVGEAERARAALHVLDWIGCAAAGARSPPGEAMIAYGRTLTDGRCRAVGGLTLTAHGAALVNGAVGNVLEMDDFYRTAIVHPGPVVIPAALAAATQETASGPTLLDAVVRGFEAMIRVGRSVGPTHYKYFHNTATAGVFGSAAACGSVLGLSEDALVHALGNAGTQASGLWQCRLEDTMTKQLHNGRAAQSGLLAAELARCCFTGPSLIFEGPLGFFKAMCPDGQPELLLAGADEGWLIHATSFKPWPACRHTHATIDAALAVRNGIEPARIRRIVVQTYDDAVSICDNPAPATPVETKFSLQHAAAVVLLRGRPTLADFDLSAARDPAVAVLRGKVELHRDDRFTRVYPARFGAALVVELEGGEERQLDVADAFGDPENPMPMPALVDKAFMLLESGGYPRSAAEAIVSAALDLPRRGTAATFMDLLR